MALYLPTLSILLFLLLLRSSAAMWCVARFDVTSQALQAALDYACAAGADCAPIQPTGLCFLPNTIQAHASYAFNSYFQRRAMAPGSCNFAGTSTIAKTDPSMYFTNLRLNRIGFLSNWHYFCFIPFFLLRISFVYDCFCGFNSLYFCLFFV